MMEAWVYGVIGAGAVIILACLLFIVYQIFSFFYHGMHKSILPFSCTKVEESSEYKESKKGRVQSFTYTEIEAFCEGFSNLVGKGSTCYIYKGILLDGTEIAVKRFEDMVQNQPYTERKFQYQVELLSRVHHPNLVNIIGYCEDKNSRMLILQYAPNGTLSENLHGGEQLSWRQRMRIALGTAYGLSYLHYSCNLPLFFHGKFSSSNILLTEDFAAKAKQYLQCNDKMADIADPTLKNIIQRELNAICEIACLCILQEVETRPNMEAVILMLVEALGIGSETAAPITNLMTLRGLVENV